MAYTPIVSVDITLNTTASAREGFGIPLFIAAHTEFEERIRSYNNLNEVFTDFGDQSPVYAAAQSLFSQSPRVTTLYVGRRDVSTALSIAEVVEANTYTINVTVNNGVTASFQHTAGVGEQAYDVLDAIRLLVEADPNINPYVTLAMSGTGASGVLTFTPKDAQSFYHVASTTVDVVESGTGTAAEVLSAIEQESTDWYFVASEDHSDSFVLGMAAAVQSRDKMYFMSSSDVDALSGTDISTEDDILAELAKGLYTRTVSLYHNLAESVYPEMAFIAYGAPYDAGSIAWGNAQLAGIPVALNAQGNPLTTVQKQALDARNANFTEREGGVSLLRTGKTAGGEWIDVIRGVDWLTQEVSANLRDLLINQKGGKVPFNDSGITRIREVIESALQAGVNRQFLDTYEVFVPRARDVSLGDKIERILKSVTFRGILTGAILAVEVQGGVSYE